MNQSSGNVWLWVVFAVIVALCAYFVGSIKDPEIRTFKEYIKGKDSVSYKEGKTVEKIRVVTKEVFIKVYPEKDSLYSKFDTTEVFEDGSVTVRGKTYPAVDSLELEIIPMIFAKDRWRVDTLFVLRVDTMKITEQVIIEPEWYETWWFGSMATGAVALGLTILSQ